MLLTMSKITINSDGDLTVADTANAKLHSGVYLIRALANIENTHRGVFTLEKTIFIRNFDFKFVNNNGDDITEAVTTNIQDIHGDNMPKISLNANGAWFSTTLPNGLTYIYNPIEGRENIGGVTLNSSSGVFTVADFSYDKIKAIKTIYAVTLVGDNVNYFGTITKEIVVKSVYEVTLSAAGAYVSGTVPARNANINLDPGNNDFIEKEYCNLGGGNKNIFGVNGANIANNNLDGHTAGSSYRGSGYGVAFNGSLFDRGRSFKAEVKGINYNGDTVSATYGYAWKTRNGSTYTGKVNSSGAGNRADTFTIESGSNLIFYIRNNQRALAFNRTITIDPQ